MTDPVKQQVKYPEHEKLRPVAPMSQGIYEFIEWLEEQGIVLAERHTHTEDCYPDGEKYPKCGLSENDLYDHTEAREKLLARYFNIDLNRLDHEKRKMLEECRMSQAPNGG